MSSITTTSTRRKRPRILTIDNGGLQAISILLVLKDVCEALSQAEGAAETLAPYQLFDFIGGVGTGGWLAILLGRYKLKIDQCMSVYIGIANAIDPTRKRPSSGRAKGAPAAIDQERLIDKIERIIDEHGISPTLMDSETEANNKDKEVGCRAFAVGVLKREKAEGDHDYHLFRTYDSQKNMRIGPNPTTCKVSTACAATAAAQDFAKEFQLDDVTYWDDSFPHTHNVSGLALDEAAVFFPDTSPEFILSISPGIPTDKEIKTLQKFARKNAPKRVQLKYSLRRAFSGDGKNRTMPAQLLQPDRAESSPAILGGEHHFRRTDTGSSASSLKQELKHQDAIKRRLVEEFGEEAKRLYQRLSFDPAEGMPDEKPYLNDIAKPDEAMDLADNFLKLSETRSIIDSLVAMCKGPSDSLLGGLVPENRCDSPEPATSANLPDTTFAQDHALRENNQPLTVV